MPRTSRAIALTADPLSRAALFHFDSPEERTRLLRDWFAVATGTEQPAAPALTFYLNISVQSSYPLPSGGTVHAMYPEGAEAGELCLTYAHTTRDAAALPALNNWCMDQLDLWAD